MTDRINRLTVILDREYRTDDVQAIVAAVGMVKGVLSVTEGEPVSISDYTAHMTIYSELFRVVNSLLFEGRTNSELYKQVKRLLTGKD